MGKVGGNTDPHFAISFLTECHTKKNSFGRFSLKHWLLFFCVLMPSYGRRRFPGRRFGRRRTFKRRRSVRGRRSFRGKGKRAGVPGRVQRFKTISGRLVLPDRALVGMAYHTEFNIVSDTVLGTTTQWYTFRLNSIFDPDLTSTGHQPVGHDQMALFYNYYRVLSVKYNFKCTVSQAGALSPGINEGYDTMLWFSSTSATSSYEIEDLKELGAYRRWRSGTTNLAKPMSMTGTAVPAKILGMSKEAYRCSDNTWQIFGANPVFQCYLHVGFQTRGLPSTDMTFRVDLTLTYNTACTNRRTPPVS